MIQRTRHDAASVQDGANRYAEQTLGELEQRLKEMAQVVLAGRQELVKIQMIRPDSSAPETETPEAKNRQGKAVTMNKARRAASRLRSMKGTG